MSDRHLPQHKDPDRVQRPVEEVLSAQPEAAVPIDTGPNGVTLSGTPPANPTARQLRRSSIEQTQRQLGNRHVARMLAQRDPAAASSSAAGGPSASSSASGPAAPGGLIVDDSVADLQPGQAKKSQFLAQLRAQVDATVQAELGSTPLLAQANQEIETRFAQYNGLSGPALEQTIKRETPGAGAPTTAQEYIAPICAQVRSKVAEQRAALPPGAEAAASAVGAVAGAASSVAAGVSSVASSVAGVLFKAREGGAHAPDDPRAVQAQLTAGQPLDGQVRGGLEQAFGANLSDVRVHTGGQAAQLSEQMNARAFTVGRDIGFGSGEYQPGTPVGDALIAHEAAHVLQQGSASTPVVQQKGGDYGALEADADRSAVGAVASMWGGARGAFASLWGGTKGSIAQLARTSIPQLTTGLRLQGCGGSTPTVVPPVRDTLIPFDFNPLSAPGERILFNDTYTHASPSEFELVYSANGGTFDTAAGAATKTVPGLTSGNVSFFIGSAWDGTTPVNVTLSARHRTSGNVMLTDTWNFGKKVNLPTTITQQEAEGERALGSTYSYKVGPDRGADNVDDYLHQTILETFGQRTCNIAVADLKPEFRSAHPEITSPESVTAHFFGTSSNNGTFTVSAGDKIYDQHNGGMPDKSVFEAALTTMKEITVDLPQTYEIQTGVALGHYTIRRIMKMDGSKMMRKMHV
jgi:hypothetical protein